LHRLAGPITGSLCRSQNPDRERLRDPCAPEAAWLPTNPFARESSRCGDKNDPVLIIHVGPGVRGTTLDAGDWLRYDPGVTEEARPAERPGSEANDAERERFIAKIERSLAKLDAGQRIPHAEVLAMIDARYPESKK
jgi:hypothetical protein